MNEQQKNWTVWRVPAAALREWIKSNADVGRGIWCYEGPFRGDAFYVSQYHRTAFSIYPKHNVKEVFLARYKDYPCLLQMREDKRGVCVVLPFCELSPRNDRSCDITIHPLSLPPLQRGRNYEDPQLFIYATYQYEEQDKSIEEAIDLNEKGWAFRTYKNALNAMLEDLGIYVPPLKEESESEVFDFIRKHIPHEDEKGIPITCPEFGSAAEIPPLQREMPEHLTEMLDMLSPTKPRRVQGPEPRMPFFIAEQAFCDRKGRIWWSKEWKNILENQDYPFIFCS